MRELIRTGAHVHGADLLQLLRAAADAQARLAEAVQGSGLSADRWRVLRHVAENPGASMSDVVDALLLAPATATRAVDALVEVGAVYRAADPADRRRVALRASAEGGALLRAVDPAVGALEAELAARPVALG